MEAGFFGPILCGLCILYATTHTHQIWQLKTFTSIFGRSRPRHRWRATLNRLPTKLNLKKRRVLLKNDLGLCLFCGKDVESEEHLLLTCCVTERIWKHWCSCIGSHVVMPNDLRTHYWQHPSMVRGKLGGMAWTMVSFTIIWCVWRLRNDMIFNHVLSFHGI